MKKIDFSQTGKMPLTQNILDYVQSSMRELVEGFAKIGGQTTGPFIISGCKVTATPAGGALVDYSIAAGWILYQSEVIRVDAQALVGVDTATNEPYLVLTHANTTLTFQDASTPAVKQNNSMVFTNLASSTAEDATTMKLSSLKPFVLNEDWINIVVTGVDVGSVLAAVDGTIDYKKSLMTNSVLIKGALHAANADTFDSMDPSVTSTLVATLPVGYRPLSEGYFDAEIWNEAPGSGDFRRVKDAYTDGALIYKVPGQVLPNGKIMIQFPQAADYDNYDIQFKAMIPLD